MSFKTKRTLNTKYFKVEYLTNKSKHLTRFLSIKANDGLYNYEISLSPFNNCLILYVYSNLECTDIFGKTHKFNVNIFKFTRQFKTDLEHQLLTEIDYQNLENLIKNFADMGYEEFQSKLENAIKGVVAV